MLYRRMKNQIYSYRDPDLEYKVKMLRDSVCYFKDAEREPLVDIAFQMSITAYYPGTAIIKQHAKIRSIYVIFDGLVLA
jgi:signal-transduction protein with cAMP-binding, CBS, and nucleotidyltransferase domain